MDKVNGKVLIDRAVTEIKRSSNKKARRQLMNVYTTGYVDGYALAYENFIDAIRTTPGIGPKRAKAIEDNLVKYYNNNSIVELVESDEEGPENE